MMERWKWLLACAGGLIAAFAKQYYLIVIFVSIAICMDWITGIIGSKAVGEPITSKKGTVGFWKKMALLAALFFGFFLDYFVPYAVEALGIQKDVNAAVFGMIIGCYIVLNESISICENLYKTNPAIIPQWVVRFLNATKDKIDKKED